MSVRARAREAAEDGGDEESSAFRRALLPVETPSEAPARTPWPAAYWDLRYYEAVVLVELFEELFGRPAKFSFDRRSDHGRALRRILDRFDRFAWADPRYHGDPHGPPEGRPGFRRARELVGRRGRLAQLGNVKAQRPESLAYFLPRLDQESKALRRRARALEAEESP